MTERRDEFSGGTGDVTTRPSGTIWPQAVKVTIPDSFVVGPKLDADSVFLDTLPIILARLRVSPSVLINRSALLADIDRPTRILTLFLDTTS